MKQKLADIIYRLSPNFYYGLRYFLIRKRSPNFNKPFDLSEWILGEMLKPSFKRYATHTDKVLVRDYVEAKGLKNILPKIYGIWNNVNEIDIDMLPDRFALKTNHGCGNHVIVTDKNKLDLNRALYNLNKTLNTTFSIREPHYKFIVPKVYGEEFIEDGNGILPIDYKFMCSQGKIMCILVCSERGNKLKLSVFNSHWEDISKEYLHEKEWHTSAINKPNNLEQMCSIASKLSEDFDFVRVDLYDTGTRVVFSELTFTPHSGLLGYFNMYALKKMYSYIK
ncbi:MAG: ATP-grasp fold amidoligase family protein [Marinifilaceae bacterium]